MTDKLRLARTIADRRDSDPYSTWGYHSRVSVEHRYVCVPIPKVACTTTKTILRRLAGLPVTGNVHDQGEHLADFSVDANVQMLTAPDWLRFSFVRNPYARLYSAYKSKIGNTWEQQYDWLRIQIRDAFDYPTEDGSKVGMVTFDDFVHYVAETDDPRILTDGHLALQTEVLQQDCINYDIIGRFETFQSDFASVLTTLDASPEVVSSVSEIINPTPYSPLAAAYRRELADLVYGLYRDDFELWGYTRDSWLFDG